MAERDAVRTRRRGGERPRDRPFTTGRHDPVLVTRFPARPALVYKQNERSARADPRGMVGCWPAGSHLPGGPEVAFMPSDGAPKCPRHRLPHRPHRRRDSPHPALARSGPSRGSVLPTRPRRTPAAPGEAPSPEVPMSRPRSVRAAALAAAVCAAVLSASPQAFAGPPPLPSDDDVQTPLRREGVRQGRVGPGPPGRLQGRRRGPQRPRPRPAAAGRVPAAAQAVGEVGQDAQGGDRPRRGRARPARPGRGGHAGAAPPGVDRLGLPPQGRPQAPSYDLLDPDQRKAAVPLVYAESLAGVTEAWRTARGKRELAPGRRGRGHVRPGPGDRARDRPAGRPRRTSSASDVERDCRQDGRAEADHPVQGGRQRPQDGPARSSASSS